MSQAYKDSLLIAKRALEALKAKQLQQKTA